MEGLTDCLEEGREDECGCCLEGQEDDLVHVYGRVGR